MRNQINQARLKELLHYNPETGVFTWKSRVEDTHYIRGWNKRYAGKQAGSVIDYKTTQYVYLSILNIRYAAHRIAWLYVWGEFPPEVIDHDNGIGTDNRIDNLKAVTHAANHRNSRKVSSNTSGFTGVSWAKRRSVWIAEIGYDRERYYLGQFKTKEEAIEARKAANIKFGFHSNHGRGLN